MSAPLRLSHEPLEPAPAVPQGQQERLDVGDRLRNLGALDDDTLIFGPEVARMLSVSLTTFHQRRRHGELPIREVRPRLDRRPRFRLGDVRAFIRGAHAQKVRRSAA